MKNSVEVVSNKDITSSKLNEIVTLKMQHWKYTRDEHINWMKSNLLENDQHLLFYDEVNNLLAYLNLVNVTVSYGSTSKEYIGVGNVCVDKRVNARGIGLLLMNLANFYLKQFDRQGILLCKNELDGFYQKAGWKIYSGNCVISGNIYSHSVFLTDELDTPKIIINENF